MEKNYHNVGESSEYKFRINVQIFAMQVVRARQAIYYL